MAWEDIVISSADLKVEPEAPAKPLSPLVKYPGGYLLGKGLLRVGRKVAGIGAGAGKGLFREELGAARWGTGRLKALANLFKRAPMPPPPKPTIYPSAGEVPFRPAAVTRKAQLGAMKSILKKVPEKPLYSPQAIKKVKAILGKEIPKADAKKMLIEAAKSGKINQVLKKMVERGIKISPLTLMGLIPKELFQVQPGAMTFEEAIKGRRPRQAALEGM